MVSEATASFSTHANYIAAIRKMIDEDNNDSGEKLYLHIYDRIKSKKILPKHTRQSIDENNLKKCLSNSWGTEFILLAPRKYLRDDEVVRLSNNWGVIQAYYVFYHSTQALFIAKGQVRPDSHTKTQKTFCKLWSERNIDLSPWTLAYNSTGIKNLPPGITYDETIHNWTSCNLSNRWSLVGKVLKSTRKDFLFDAISNRRKNKLKAKKRRWDDEEAQRLSQGKRPRKIPNFSLPRLTDDEKQEVNNSLRSYTIMDYLYRLRIKSNYEDSNMFLDGPTDDVLSKVVRKNLCDIASATSFINELFILSIWGKDKFMKYLDYWKRSNLPSDFIFGLSARYDILSNL